MPVYHYKDSSLIERVEVRSPRHGIAHATIFCAPGVDAAQMETLRTQLGQKKFSTLMDAADGRAAIEVRGLKDAEALIKAIDAIDTTNKSVEKQDTPEDHKEVGFREKVRGSALFLSAIFYDLGNVAFLASGWQRGKHNPGGKMTPHDRSEMMIGAAFGVGDIVMTAYGGHRGDEELMAAEQGLKRHLHQKGIAIPKGDELNPDSLHESGAFKATDRWLRHNVTRIKCLSETAGGLFTIHAGLKPGNVNRSKVAAGLLVSAGWFATALLDKPTGHQIFDGDDAPETVIEKIKHNPRGMLARPVAVGNNLANLWGALGPGGERIRFRNEVLDAQKQAQLNPGAQNAAQLRHATAKQHDYAWNVMSACSFLVANTLFGLSGSKRPAQTEDDRIMTDDLVLLASNVLARQPAQAREAAIDETAEYVAQLSHVTCGKQAVAEAIHEKIAGLSKSGWAAKLQPALGAGMQQASL